jgi:hypothetical protein
VLVEALAERQVGWRRLQRLQLADAVVDEEGHGEAPGDVHVEMAVHQPHPRVVRHEPYHRPPVHRHAHRVPHRRILHVELGRVGAGIEVAQPLGEDVEVVAVEVDGVVLAGEDVGALEHHLHGGAVLELVHLGARHRLPQRAAHVLRRVVELHRRARREVGGEHAAGCAVVVRLEDGGGGGEHEGDVVDARREPRPVGPAALLRRGVGAVEEADADGEEEALVHARRELRLAEAAQVRREGGGGGGVVVRREGRHGDGGAGGVVGGAVVEDGGGGGVVEGDALGAGVGAGGEVVAAGRLVEGDEDVGGLAGGEEEEGGGVRFGVGGVGGDDGHVVTGEGDEELRVERGVDEAEEVGLAGGDGEDGRVVGGAAVEVAGLGVDGEGVGDVGSSAGARGGAHHVDGVHVPPLPEQDGGELSGGLDVEGVAGAIAGADEEGAVDGGAEPGGVSVPPEGALLRRHREAIPVALPGPHRALRHVLRPVRPPRPHLPHPVPVQRHVVPPTVYQVDDQRVPFVYLQRRPRELTVHRHYVVALAQPLHCCLPDHKLMVLLLGSSQGAEQCQA